jgi:hypothetical protein
VEGLSVVRVLLGYAVMIISSAATSVAIMAACVICTADHISIGLLLFSLFNHISIITFMVAALIALVFSSVPFAIFIVIGELKHIRCLSWYLAAALATLMLFFSFVVLGKSTTNHSFEPLMASFILNFAYVFAQAAVGTFAYWKISGRFAGTTDEQMYGPF